MEIRNTIWKIRNVTLIAPGIFENWNELITGTKIGILKKYNLKFEFPKFSDYAHDTFLLWENFFNNQYDSLNVKGKVVVDLGANMGDTAILFCYKKAKRVIAFEPYLYQYNKAKRNILLNNMANKITLKREAVDAKAGHMVIKTGYTDGSQKLEDIDENGLSTKVTTLTNIIKSYNATILKSDCEGSEYNIILSTPQKELAKLEQMVIDYHEKGPEKIVAHLKKAGFHTTVTKDNEKSGRIYAIKNKDKI